MTPEATTHSFDPTILREYDIRGRLGETLTEHDALMLGRAFGTMVKRRGGHKVAIGYDGRETSPHFADKLSEGIDASPVIVGKELTLRGQKHLYCIAAHNP